ncbi:hypothetical protein P7K49_024776 [Saguinus oedipus]|uniref:Uncharacterized protein n=1 Tax=Saguinus oedipus TaxID=9490 RepID=A0ABQ9UR88_SAGOE|nr:hypothetical protein P7K49_024776 [Saguinus oedipus]
MLPGLSATPAGGGLTTHPTLPNPTPCEPGDGETVSVKTVALRPEEARRGTSEALASAASSL